MTPSSFYVMSLFDLYLLLLFALLGVAVWLALWLTAALLSGGSE